MEDSQLSQNKILQKKTEASIFDCKTKVGLGSSENKLKLKC